MAQPISPSIEPIVEWHGHVLTAALVRVDKESVRNEVSVNDIHHERLVAAFSSTP